MCIKITQNASRHFSLGWLQSQFYHGYWIRLEIGNAIKIPRGLIKNTALIQEIPFFCTYIYPQHLNNIQYILVYGWTDRYLTIFDVCLSALIVYTFCHETLVAVDCVNIERLRGHASKCYYGNRTNYWHYKTNICDFTCVLNIILIAYMKCTQLV